MLKFKRPLHQITMQEAIFKALLFNKITYPKGIITANHKLKGFKPIWLNQSLKPLPVDSKHKKSCFELFAKRHQALIFDTSNEINTYKSLLTTF